MVYVSSLALSNHDSFRDQESAGLIVIRWIPADTGLADVIVKLVALRLFFPDFSHFSEPQIVFKKECQLCFDRKEYI